MFAAEQQGSGTYVYTYDLALAKVESLV